MEPSAGRLRLSHALYGLALLIGVAPLWVGRQLPLVDLPQHLHLISVMHRLSDPTTLYPRLFALRGELTPYLGYYVTVDLLSWLLPLELANKLFLSAYVIGLPLAMAFLLRSLGRPRWVSLLALPFAYGDSFAWGFLNYCAALPLTLLSCGLFVRALSDAPRRRAWAVTHAFVLSGVLLFHVQAFGFLAFALPVLLGMTRAEVAPGAGRPRAALGAWLGPRVPALASVVPGVTLFLVWVVGRLGQPAEVQAGVPWKAWGPMLSRENLSFLSFEDNRARLWDVLANELRDGQDRLRIYAACGIAVAGVTLALWHRAQAPSRERPWERLRMLALATVAFGLYFALPFDIRGYMYYLNTRFAHLAVPLLLCAVPPVAARARPWLLAAGVALALIEAVPLVRGYGAFDAEAAPLISLAERAPAHPYVMGLVYDTRSAVVTHPVYLHAAAVVARLRGGVANFSFALTPQSPLRFQGSPPPTFPSEWNPRDFRWETMGAAYDAFVVKGPPPEPVFGALLSSELTVVGRDRDLSLTVKR